MCSAGRFCRACPDVGLMVIGDDDHRLGLGGRPGAAEECLGGGQVPAFTKQYVDNLAVLIDGAVEVPLDRATEEENLVDDQRRPSRRRCRRDAAASCGPKVWLQVSTVRAETSMPRSARSSVTCRRRAGRSGTNGPR